MQCKLIIELHPEGFLGEGNSGWVGRHVSGGLAGGRRVGQSGGNSSSSIGATSRVRRPSAVACCTSGLHAFIRPAVAPMTVYLMNFGTHGYNGYTRAVSFSAEMWHEGVVLWGCPLPTLSVLLMVSMTCVLSRRHIYMFIYSSVYKYLTL